MKLIIVDKVFFSCEFECEYIMDLGSLFII